MSRTRLSTPKTPQERESRVQDEAERIQAIVNLAKPYGVKVALYVRGG